MYVGGNLVEMILLEINLVIGVNHVRRIGCRVCWCLLTWMLAMRKLVIIGEIRLLVRGLCRFTEDRTLMETQGGFINIW